MAEEQKPERRRDEYIEPLNYIKAVVPTGARPVVKPTRKRRTR